MLKEEKRTLNSPPGAMAAARARKNESGAESLTHHPRAAANNAADISIYDENWRLGNFGALVLPKSWYYTGSITQINLHIHSRVAVFSTGWYLQPAEKNHPAEVVYVDAGGSLFDGVGHRVVGDPVIMRKTR